MDDDDWGYTPFMEIPNKCFLRDSHGFFFGWNEHIPYIDIYEEEIMIFINSYISLGKNVNG